MTTIHLTLPILWAIILFGGFAFGHDPERRQRTPAWARIGSSFVLVVASWAWFIVVQGSELARFGLLLAAGMSLGFVGDLFMWRKVVLGGMGSFGLGHIAYIIAIWQFGNQIGADEAGARWGALGVWLLLGALGWFIVVFRGQQPSVLHYAALPYALLLSATAGSATGLGLQIGLFLPMALGAALFLLSDLFIAGELFSDLSFPYIGDAIWLTYGPAQMLIVYAVWAALQAVSSG